MKCPTLPQSVPHLGWGAGADKLSQEGLIIKTRITAVLLLGGMWMMTGMELSAEPLSSDRTMFEAQQSDPEFAAAWRDYEAGRYPEAYEAFSRLFREQPESAEVNLAYALSAKKAGKYSHAALALDRVLASQSGNLRARLELADAYFLMQQYDLARQQFEEVLDARPPEGVRDNINRYLSAMEEQERRWRASLRVDVGGFYDDNVNVGPVDAVVSIAPIHSGSLWVDQLSVSPESQPQEAWGLFGSLNAAGETEIGRRGFWKGYGWLGAYQSVLDDHREYEMGFYNAAVGLKRDTARTAVQIPARFEYVLRGHEALARIYGMSPSVVYAFRSRLHWLTLGNVEYRDYVHDTDYTGVTVAFGETARWFWGRDRNSVSIGARVIRENAREDIYANWGVEGSLSADYKLVAGTVLYALLQGRWSKYDERPPLAEEDRDDRQAVVSCGVNQRLTDRWSVDFSYRFTRNNSNFDLYTYERNVFTVNTSCTF